MLLAIDVGNTNIQFALYEGAQAAMSFRLSTRRDATSDEIGLAARSFFHIHGIDPSGIEEILIVSVVPPIMHALTRAMQGYFGKTPHVIGEDLTVPIENCYGHPKEVGADRLVGAYAGKQRFGYPLIVVDMGTATTFDTVGLRGEYLGGAIFPGVKLSLEALSAHASKLPRVEIADPGWSSAGRPSKASSRVCCTATRERCSISSRASSGSWARRPVSSAPAGSPTPSRAALASSRVCSRCSSSMGCG